MPTPAERLRPPPSVRERGSIVELDLAAAARALREEPHPSRNGHRQIGLVHRGGLRMVLFAFEPGGTLPDHRAPGLVVIHALTGRLSVRTPEGRHELRAGDALLLDPDVPHSIDAAEASDMLLTIHLQGTSR